MAIVWPRNGTDNWFDWKITSDKRQRQQFNQYPLTGCLIFLPHSHDAALRFCHRQRAACRWMSEPLCSPPARMFDNNPPRTHSQCIHGLQNFNYRSQPSINWIPPNGKLRPYSQKELTWLWHPFYLFIFFEWCQNSWWPHVYPSFL